MPTEDHQENQYSLLDKIQLIVSTLLYTIDVGTDVYAAYKYYAGGYYDYFAYTVTFILVVPVAIMCLNVNDYWLMPESSSFTVTRKMAGFRIVCTVIFPLALYPRFVDCWKSGTPMGREFKNFATFRLVESFVESAPQLMLNLHIVGKNGLDSLGIFQAASMAFSIVSLALSFAMAPGTLMDGKSHNLLSIAILTVAHVLFIAARCIVFTVPGPVILEGVFMHALLFACFFLVVERALLLPQTALDTVAKMITHLVKVIAILIGMPLFSACTVFSFFVNKLSGNFITYLTTCFLEGVLLALSVLGTDTQIIYRQSKSYWMFGAALALSVLSGLLFVTFFKFECNIKEWGDRLSDKLSGCCKSEAKHKKGTVTDESLAPLTQQMTLQ